MVHDTNRQGKKVEILEDNITISNLVILYNMKNISEILKIYHLIIINIFP